MRGRSIWMLLILLSAVILTGACGGGEGDTAPVDPVVEEEVVDDTTPAEGLTADDATEQAPTDEYDEYYEEDAAPAEGEEGDEGEPPPADGGDEGPVS